MNHVFSIKHDSFFLHISINRLKFNNFAVLNYYQLAKYFFRFWKGNFAFVFYLTLH